MRYSLDSNKPVLDNPKPVHCQWCGNSLAQIRNVYKGKDCQRYYCSIRCCECGEDRALRYVAALAGTVSMHWTATLAAVLSVLMVAFIFTGGTKAWAHDPSTHQADNLANATSEAYGTCCNGDDYSKIRIEEWETTATGYRVHYKGQWIEGSRTVKVNNMDNSDGEAKAWIYYAEGVPYLRCFMAGARS